MLIFDLMIIVKLHRRHIYMHTIKGSKIMKRCIANIFYWLRGKKIALY